MLNTKHWRDGDNGQYFYFSQQALSEILGPGWDRQKFKVFVRGSYWSGVDQVIVFKDNIHGAHGRLSKGYAPNQWKTGDTISFNELKC